MLDEEGRDRTPKPLLGSSRPYAAAAAGSTEGSVWSSEGPGDYAFSGSSERPAPAAPPALDSLRSVSFKLADVPLPGDAGAATQALPLPPPLLPGAEAGDPAAATPAAAPTPAPAGLPAPMLRARAAQADGAATTARGCQVLPWELPGASERASQGEAEEAVPGQAHGSADAAGEAAAAAGAEALEAEAGGGQEEEAMAALQAAGGALEPSFRGPARSESRMRTESPVGRTSRQDLSRRSSGTSVQQGELTDRSSMMSRATFMQARHAQGHRARGGGRGAPCWLTAPHAWQLHSARMERTQERRC